jgi:transcriptional regulator with XRE-family HTH domain
MKRNVKQIKIWMIRRGLREKDIVAATGEDQRYVNNTLNGRKNCRPVLQYLRDQGCPVRYLALPADMQAAA